MAVPEGRSIYEVLGTVLYRTVPVNIDDANVQRKQQQQWDDFNVPLDYDTALALREIDEATMAARYLATKARGAASATAGGATSRDGAMVADRVSSATTTRASAAATSTVPVPPQRSSTPSFTSARHGGSGSGGGQLSAAKTSQCALRFGSPSENSLATNFRSSVEVAGGQRNASEAVDIATQNAYLVKARMNAAAAAKSTGSGTGVVPAAARSSRDGIGAMTVAQAMEILFPVEAVGYGGGSREDSAKDGEEKASDGAPTPPLSASTSRVLSSATAAAARSAASTPVMWRRADVAHLSRLDVVLLYKHLERRCACESARPRGVVCPNRECIYNDGLRELIRQVTLLCPERGLLLDELARRMRQAIETYDVLLDSANQYAVRKSTERDLHQYLFAEKTDLETEVRRREHRVNEWRAKYAGLQKRFQEQQEADRKLHAEEIAYAKRANQQLVSEIKRLASEAGKAKGA
ncbi:Axonemal dynein light chain [Leishmania donovani]|uniref:Axonemal_dynein_light_chain_-_putative n=3 Tax=Leishmania donovani species complex TaxID=38574 RepID=A0A6L0XS67_LEIIN|nr:conserved hypothetical protein [Leishmania infantum JPCM5]CAC9496554.1 Axonemal_dynein_light_chain_-_putative [Leishmania infantum]CAJ1989698.1 Axonemal dynein light chain [Leishmania donovani]CAM68828.1 conserved hypothetical protein [Leishmania infantum JPCM5]SUZ42702.1 Axonemal_dynein_light_chain_-_putative [Leishmania infantum]VDZ45563.1 Axonemal_dynein_light_chain_putative/Pfam:PF10211 [Leishmania donovani]|eukprot:XP_001470452.1 conserved hypothetical protein [Leishmania infantum JPCM5]